MNTMGLVYEKLLWLGSTFNNKHQTKIEVCQDVFWVRMPREKPPELRIIPYRFVLILDPNGKITIADKPIKTLQIQVISLQCFAILCILLALQNLCGG